MNNHSEAVLWRPDFEKLRRQAGDEKDRKAVLKSLEKYEPLLQFTDDLMRLNSANAAGAKLEEAGYLDTKSQEYDKAVNRWDYGEREKLRHLTAMRIYNDFENEMQPIIARGLERVAKIIEADMATATGPLLSMTSKWGAPNTDAPLISGLRSALSWLREQAKLHPNCSWCGSARRAMSFYFPEDKPL